MKAILITGNPRFIGTPQAKNYYNEIVKFVESQGVSITRDPGEDYTCPPKADFYIGHSRGAGREICLRKDPNKERIFLRFSDIGGYNHPVDDVWLKGFKPGSKETPPDEHFNFCDVQKQAILDVIKFVKKSRPAIERW